MNTQKGVIITDIILATGLSLIFIVIISNMTHYARQTFNRAKEKDSLLSVFENNKEVIDSLSPDESLLSASSSRSVARMYGNHMKQVDTYLGSSSVIFRQVAVNSSDEFPNAPGTPICLVDFGNTSVLGSYTDLYGYNSSSTADINWQIVSSANFGLDHAIPITDLEVRNSIAFISADSSVASDPDLFIAKINSTSTTVISSLNTGPGLQAIVLAGDRIYSAAPSTVAQLHIIRLDGLSHPVLETKYKLPLPYATSTSARGSAIFYNKEKVYLGTEKWDGEEFNIIDVSNPLAPIRLGGFEINSKVNDIYVQNNIAYVAASNVNQLIVLDVSNPQAPTVLEIFSPSGWERQEGKRINVFENSILFGRTSGGFDIPNDHEAFMKASTTESFPNSFSKNLPGGVYGLLADRKSIYLVSRELDKELQIFDLGLGSLRASYSLPIEPHALTCDRDKLYILAK